MAARNPLAEILDRTLEPSREPELLEDEGRADDLQPLFRSKTSKAPNPRP